MVWGHNCERLIKKFKKKALRVVNLCKYNAYCDPLSKKFKILKSPDLLKMQKLKAYFKYVGLHSELTTYANVVIHEFAQRCLRYNIIKTVKILLPQLLIKLLLIAYRRTRVSACCVIVMCV